MFEASEGGGVGEGGRQWSSLPKPGNNYLMFDLVYKI